MLATLSNVLSKINNNNFIGKGEEMFYIIDKKSIIYFIEYLELSMNKISTYEGLMLIITVAGVFVNYLVVRSALLQYKRKISLEITEHVQFPVGMGNENNQQLRMFSLIVKNKGYCNVKLCQWGYTTDKKIKMQILELSKNIFPVEILSYDTYTFQIPLKNLLDEIKRNIEDKLISKRVLYFYVLDTVGNTYYVKLHEKVCDFIKRGDECCKNDKWDLAFY